MSAIFDSPFTIPKVKLIELMAYIVFSRLSAVYSFDFV
jgi:hypothetical protein